MKEANTVGRKKLRMSLDRLAELMQGGFSEIHERLDAHDDHFEKIDGRLDSMEGRLGNLESGQEVTNRILDRMDTRLATLELSQFGVAQASSRATVTKEMNK